MATIFATNTKGIPHSNLANINAALVHDKELRNKIWHDQFLDRIMTGDPPREWTDADDTRTAVYLQQKCGLLHVTSRQVSEIVNRHARESPRHCVRDYFLSLHWDGEPHIDEAFCDHWDATPSRSQPHEYLRAISRNFFLGLVARVMTPGCQLDEMVVFESAQQGQFKTSALRVIGGPWYAAAHERVTDKDFFQDLQGKLVIEISELSAFSKAQVERIKSVISNPNDHYRGSYDRRSSDHPRQCVFAGTTNADDWGADDTGLRRFWPVRVGAINLPTLCAARDQLFAEAFVRQQAGEPWWHVPDSASDVQADRQAYDEWTSLVLPWCDLQLAQGEVFLTIRDILSTPLKFQPAQIDKPAQMRVARILKLNNWRKDVVIVNGKTTKVWWPPTT